MLHPAVRFALWAAAVAALQLTEGAELFGAAALSLVAAAAAASGRLARLLRRSRWLLLTLAILFAWATPGLYVAPELGAWGPTHEGLALAAAHLARLSGIIALTALLMQLTPLDQLLAGLFSLLRPLAALGLDRRRLAVRLMLVLTYVEQKHRGRWRDWLEAASEPAVESRYTLALQPVRVRDLAALAIAAGAIAFLL